MHIHFASVPDWLWVVLCGVFLLLGPVSCLLECSAIVEKLESQWILIQSSLFFLCACFIWLFIFITVQGNRLCHIRMERLTPVSPIKSLLMSLTAVHKKVHQAYAGCWLRGLCWWFNFIDCHRFHIWHTLLHACLFSFFWWLIHMPFFSSI